MNPGGELLTTAGSKMPKNKGADGATARVVGLTPDRRKDASSIVPGRKKERAGEVSGGVWVLWQEEEGGPLGWLLFPLGRSMPAHLKGHQGGWGGGGEGGGQGAQVKLAIKNLKGITGAVGRFCFVFLQQRAGTCRAGPWWERC